MKTICLAVFLFTLSSVIAQETLPIVPMPSSVKVMHGQFELNEATIFVLEGSGLEGSASFFNDYLRTFYGFSLKTAKADAGANSIVLNFERMDFPIPGAYKLEVTNDRIYISGDNEAGVFYGIQTLIQLLPIVKKKSLLVQQVNIADGPRFSYRGMHLDVARHFFSVGQVKKFIDLLAYHKFNKFHWHLTDDQGWRIEIKKYPLLTEIGSCRAQTQVGRMGNDLYDSTKYCGFYTQDEAREIVQYAAARYITVIPEIDIPGHSLAAMAAYPFLGCTKGPYKVRETWGVASEVLCAGNDSTYYFMQDVLDEIMTIFPSKYIHIGGDECPKEKWKECPICQQRIKIEHLKNEEQLQSWFTHRIGNYVNAKGRKIIGWDEILEGGLAPNAVVMSWRGESGGVAAAKLGHDVIMTPEKPLYLNFSQSRNEDSVTQGGYNSLEDVYRYVPVPESLSDSQAIHILGAQGNCWTEYISNSAKLEYMLFPRMAALSESVWSPLSKKDWASFEERLPKLLERYRFQSINYSDAHYGLQTEILAGEKNEILWKLTTRNKQAGIIYVIDSNTNASFKYKQPVRVGRPGLYGAALTGADNKIISNWTWQKFKPNLATGSNISLAIEPNKSYSLGGAFSLIDGIQNEQGMLKASQFLGFNGRDFEAVIDLRRKQPVKEIILHAFEQKISWIYRPQAVSISVSADGKTYRELASGLSATGMRNLRYAQPVGAYIRFIRVKAKNKGMIQAGELGAGHNAWLFVDEIEVL